MTIGQLQLNEPDGERCVLIEDDGRTGYAYLIEAGQIVSDVWLYNGDGAPSDPSWDDPADLPFANKARFMATDSQRIDALTSLTVRWDDVGAQLYLDGVVVARVERGATPGWSRNAAIEGPLARPLASYDR